MDRPRISDYFVMSGVSEECRKHESVFCPNRDPITDITVINRSNHEPIPKGWECVEKTPGNNEANLSQGVIQGSKFFLCFKRGRDKPPLLDVGVYYYDEKERVSAECKIIKQTPSGFSANLCSGGSTKIYLTFRRSTKPTPYNQLVVTDICVILPGKNESPPQAFCLIEKNLNKGYFSFGSNVFLCYKKIMDRPPHLSFSPVLLDRFPVNDYPHYPLPVSLPMFCLPMGATIECWPKSDFVTPALSTFILTTSLCQKIYGTVLTYYEEIHPNLLSREELRHLINDENLKDDEKQIDYDEILSEKCFQRIKSMCLLSHWPFFDQFKNFLKFLYLNFVEQESSVPIELFVFHFMQNIPFPSPDRPNIMVNLSPSYENLLFSQTFDSVPIPSNGASFKKLLQNLGPDNCMHLLLFMLTEQKVLLHSLRMSVLTEFAEALVTMIFPFNWNYPYIPLCPLSLAGVLNAPLPFIVGIYSQYFDYFESPPDVVSIDCDTRAIYLSESKRILNLKYMPRKETKLLREKLDSINKEIETDLKNSFNLDYQAKRKQDRKIENEIQEAFLYFMASILKNFHNYLKPITAAPRIGATDPTTLFDFEGFLKENESNIDFYSQLSKTQMFTKFIEERSLVSDKNVSLAFFDDCIEKVEKFEKINIQQQKSTNPVKSLKLIDFDDRTKSTKTVFITMPHFISEGDHLEQSVRFIGKFNSTILSKLKSKYLNLNGESNDSETRVYDLIDGQYETNSDLKCYIYAKRTKHEILKSQKNAQQSSKSVKEWAKFLLINAYSLWFTHFPAFSATILQSTSDQSKKNSVKTLSIAYEVLQRMQSMDFSVPDEFCYRILMILCSIYHQPALAVKVFLNMRRHKVRLNAITYGYYNKAVLECDWPVIEKNVRWIKLRNVFRVVWHFKKQHMNKVSTLNLTFPKHNANSLNQLDKFTNVVNHLAKENDVSKNSSQIQKDFSPSAGLLFSSNSKKFTKKISTDLTNSKSRIIHELRKRHKSTENGSENEISREELKHIVQDLIVFKNLYQAKNNGKLVNNHINQKEKIESKRKTSTSDESNFSQKESEDNVSEKSTKGMFSNVSFVTPIKQSLVNMDFIKSPIGNKLRSSFKLAKSFTKSKYNTARSTLYNSDKSLNNLNSFYVKPGNDQTKLMSPTTPKSMSRSSTLPQTFASANNNTSTPDSLISNNLQNADSSFKSQLQQYAMNSPEYFYSTFKSIGGKINEFKLSFATTNVNYSPAKFNVANLLNFKNDEENLNRSIDDFLDAFDENSFNLENYTELLNDYYVRPLDSLQKIAFLHEKEQQNTLSSKIVFKVEMISCTICRICDSIIYDEEIQCQWLPDDSNLNTRCIHCRSLFVPSLTIYLKDFRENDEGCLLDPISVPYLSPIVLRKELEHVLNNETYSSLTRCKFVDDHPIVYWNLLWYFTRLNLPSHFGSLVLTASSLNSANAIQITEKFNYNFFNVSIVCMWENEKFYDTPPLHLRWLSIKNEDPGKLDIKQLDFQNICLDLIELVKNKDLVKPIQFLLSERNKLKKTQQSTQMVNGKQSFNSIYRELLFLNLIYQNSPTLKPDIFDQEYSEAFDSLTQKDKDSLTMIDNPLATGAIYCRSLFKQLSLIKS